MKISVSSYSFSGYLANGERKQKDLPKKAKEMGFEAIEFTEIAGDTFEEQKQNAVEIRKAAEEAGIEIIAYAVGASLYKEKEEDSRKEVERLKRQLDLAAILGAKIFRHDVCYDLEKTGNGRSFDLMLPTIARNAVKVSDYAQTLGIRTCSENHGFICQDSDRMERLFNAVHHENYGLLVDMGNFLCADEDPAHAVSRVAPYAIHVHAKDMLYRSESAGVCSCMTRGGNYFGGTVIGEGDVPIKKCLRILKKAGYDGFVTIEFEGAGDCVSCIQRGKDNLTKIMDAL